MQPVYHYQILGVTPGYPGCVERCSCVEPWAPYHSHQALCQGSSQWACTTKQMWLWVENSGLNDSLFKILILNPLLPIYLPFVSSRPYSHSDGVRYLVVNNSVVTCDLWSQGKRGGLLLYFLMSKKQGSTLLHCGVFSDPLGLSWGLYLKLLHSIL